VIQQKAEGMGRVIVDFTLSNYQDVLQAEAGAITPDKIRQVRIRGVVDTGSTRLVLPEKVAAQLGLTPAGEVKVRYADQRTVTRPLVRNAWVQLLGRGSVSNAALEANRDDALLGAIVLEDLDLIVDCSTQTLRPRDPDHIITEIE
jgi:predicted aspartyl protease